MSTAEKNCMWRYSCMGHWLRCQHGTRVIEETHKVSKARSGICGNRIWGSTYGPDVAANCATRNYDQFSASRDAVGAASILTLIDQFPSAL